MPIEQIDDPSIEIKPTQKLIQFVKKHVTIKDAPENVLALKKSSRYTENTLKLGDIRWLRNYLIEHRKNSEVKVYIHELLEGVDVKLPEPKITPRNPVLEARIKKLTAEEDSRRYDAMTRNVDTFKKNFPEDTIAYQMKQINRQLIAVAQFIFSVMAAFAFGFIGIELILGNLDFGFRLLLGIICALIVALAEIYFLAKKLNEEFEVPQVPVHTKLHQE